MVERNLAESRSLAQRLVMAGQVRVDNEVVLKASTQIQESSNIEIKWGPQFVSRGGDKLAAALKAFPIQIKGKVCADVGASTGGFTDCLLQSGARRVYAVDVGKGILHWSLRTDDRVVVLEGTNARYLERLPEPIDMATVDVSFISLKIIFPVLRRWFNFQGSKLGDQISEQCSLIALIKPQFEVGRTLAARGDGVIRDPVLHQQVLHEILSSAQLEGYQIRGLIQSPLLGPKGNIEFLVWLMASEHILAQPDEISMERLISDLFNVDHSEEYQTAH